jgi:hypothetical protein
VSVTDIQMIWSTDRMTMAQRNLSASIKTCLSATSSTTNVTLTGLLLNRHRRYSKPARVLQEHSTVAFESTQSCTLTFLQSAFRLFVRILHSHDMFTFQIKFSMTLQSDYTA